jgi:hypothetical protein
MKLDEGPDTDVDAASRKVVSPEVRERTSHDYESSAFDQVEHSGSPPGRSSLPDGRVSTTGSIIVQVKDSPQTGINDYI